MALQQEEEETIGDVDLFALTEDKSALTVNAKWLQHLQVCISLNTLQPSWEVGSLRLGCFRVGLNVYTGDDIHMCGERFLWRAVLRVHVLRLIFTSIALVCTMGKSRQNVMFRCEGVYGLSCLYAYACFFSANC